MKPRLLDLFCGAGGCTKGYQRAGFEVVGVDIEPQPRYCGETFIQADALEFLSRLTESADDDGDDCFGVAGLDRLGLDQRRLSGVVSGGGGSVDSDRVIEAHRSSLVGDSDGYNRWAAGIKSFSAIHASPPCQDYSRAMRHLSGDYPRLIDPVKDLLVKSGLPWVIENVPGSPLATASDLFGAHGVELCGSMFGLEIRRHRLFETSFPIEVPGPCDHSKPAMNPHNQAGRDRIYANGGRRDPEKPWREEMGVPWMGKYEGRQAIPPAYTEHIGTYLMAAVQQKNPVRW